MMRANPSTSMQKTYDECFLTCSTAVYFESQGNEAEALRSWKGALDQIYYHNAHRVPTTYRPRTETERAVQESLRQLELQCKERVDLLEALKRSREETAKEGAGAKAEGSPPTPPPRPPITVANDANTMGWLGGGTIPPVGYGDLHRPSLSIRPALPGRKSSSGNPTPQPPNGSSSLYPRPSGPRKDSRTPSPEKKGRMLRTLRPGGGKERASSSRASTSSRPEPPAAAKAATLAFGSNAAGRPTYTGSHSSRDITTIPLSSGYRPSFERSGTGLDLDRQTSRTPTNETAQPQAPFYFRAGEGAETTVFTTPPKDVPADTETLPRIRGPRNDSSTHRSSLDLGRARSGQVGNTPMPTYRNEYPATAEYSRALASSAAARSWTDLEGDKHAQSATTRKPVPPPYQASSPNDSRVRRTRRAAQSESLAVEASDSSDQTKRQVRRKAKAKEDTVRADLPPTPTSDAGDSGQDTDSDEWKEKCKDIMKHLPKGVDEGAAQQILNEIVIKGDEVHWDDIAGLEVAKYALKETVVYPFLRPDLFMGLREPARGMLLFGPPGTGKTMLARGVATESRSTFFAISASSLTSKFLGESEKLVRALFALAKMLAPSIIFVDEIDSLLSSRSGSGEHEATRRIKTEFLIQWSDLAKAAAGREQSEKDKERGDASRVLVLAATNLPWAIDEAARRRFVRRQYIPLPEGDVRKSQLKTLLSHQKHELSDSEMNHLVALTDGFSGSDITALAKDAAMGPLRSLGEKLLHMTMDEIRPIRFEDFKASLINIRPSVSGKGLKEYEDWAREFGERGG